MDRLCSAVSQILRIRTGETPGASYFKSFENRELEHIEGELKTHI